MNIEQIAQETWSEVCKSSSVGQSVAVAFAKALLSKLAEHEAADEIESLRQQLSDSEAERLEQARLLMDNWQQLAEAQREAAHWKNNHETEVRRARILKERTDMPIERVQAYEKWGEDQRLLAASQESIHAQQICHEHIITEKDAEISALRRQIIGLQSRFEKDQERINNQGALIHAQQLAREHAIAKKDAEIEAMRQDFCAAIEHAIGEGVEAAVFLKCWNEGDWEGCREFGFTDPTSTPQ